MEVKVEVRKEARGMGRRLMRSLGILFCFGGCEVLFVMEFGRDLEYACN